MSTLGRIKSATGVRYYVKLNPNENAKRPKIHIGLVNLKQANTTKLFIESLIAAQKGLGLPKATQEWLAGIPDGLRVRLETLELIERSEKNRWTVSAWIANYIEKRPDVKPATKRKWKDVETKLKAFFQKDCIGNVTIQHAKNFRIYLQSIHKLAENSIRRQIGIARQFFNSAVEAELINKNPFRGQAVSVRPNESRFYFVSPEIAKKVLNTCPDAEWKLIFGLARFGGLRCPSEVLRLK
ncbi:MAG: phage integrase SAM-like domain-containing protein [Phycisphaerales bacterium]